MSIRRAHPWFATGLAVMSFASMARAQNSRGSDRATALNTAIRQRDSAEQRSKAIADVRAMLKADAASQIDALFAIRWAGDVKFDRAGLEADVAALLASPNAEIRRAALGTLPTVQPTAARIDEIAALAKDADPRVRAAVMQAIVFIRPSAKIETPVEEPALTLLNDADQTVVVNTARSFWGVALTPAVEAKVIKLSRFPDDAIPEPRSPAYDMNYYVLSTRPLISRPVAERLAEIARHPKLDQNWTGRAIWGLAHTSSPEAADTVAKALIEELDNSLNTYNREWAVRGLRQLHTPAAAAKLADVAAKDDSESLRKLAGGR